MRNKCCFPLFMDIREKKVVIIGAGKIAARRAGILTEFCDHITLVAPEIHPDLENLEKQGKVTVIRRAYRREDIYDAWMVIAATDNAKLNDEIYSVAKCLGALVNVASNQTKCDFQFPGIIKKDQFVIGINAAGTDHRGTAEMRKRIEKYLSKTDKKCEGK